MPPASPEPAAVRPFGLILAGGLARRMDGRDKALMALDADATLLDVLRARLAPQCGALAISANGDAARFAAYGLPVLPDPPGPSRGPLAGVLRGLAGAQRPDGWLLTVPGDTPFVPLDLADRLHAAATTAGRAVARACSGERRHSLVALWSCALFEPLQAAVLGRDLRKVTAFQEEAGVVDVLWAAAPYDPFFNVNTPDDLDVAATLFRHPDHALRMVKT